MKKCKLWLAAAVMLMLAVFAATGAAALDLSSTVGTFGIEQVYVNVPEMNIYFYAQGTDGSSYTPQQVQAAGVEVKLGEKAINTSSIGVASDPICYIIAIDNSDNISAEDFRNAVAAVRTLVQKKADHDQVMLYTTAGGTKCVLRATTDSMAIYKQLAGLKRAKGSMNLTEVAAMITSDIQTDYQALAPRRMAFICSNSTELLTNLTLAATLMTDVSSQANLALYAFLGTATPRVLQTLADMTSGRVIACAPEDMGTEMLKKQQEFAQALEIRTELSDEDYGTRLEKLTLSVPALGSAISDNTNVYMGHRLEKPQITKVAVLSRTKILLTFNQAISEIAGRPQYFGMVSEDIWSWHVKIKSVTLSEDGRTATLVTEPLYTGNFNISLKKVSSRLTPANISEKDNRVVLSISPWPHDRRFYLERFRIPLILTTVLLLALMIQWLRGRHKDRMAEKGAEAEHLLNDNPDDAAPTLPRRYATIFFAKAGSIAASRWSGMVEGSMMVGSDAAQCDLCVPDKKVGAQHCILCVSGDSLSVVPLEGKTVKLNGETIAGEHKLQNNDTLRIGKTNLELVL